MGNNWRILIGYKWISIVRLIISFPFFGSPWIPFIHKGFLSFFKWQFHNETLLCTTTDNDDIFPIVVPVLMFISQIGGTLPSFSWAWFGIHMIAALWWHRSLISYHIIFSIILLGEGGGVSLSYSFPLHARVLWPRPGSFRVLRWVFALSRTALFWTK